MTSDDLPEAADLVHAVLTEAVKSDGEAAAAKLAHTLWVELIDAREVTDAQRAVAFAVVIASGDNAVEIRRLRADVDRLRAALAGRLTPGGN